MGHIWSVAWWYGTRARGRRAVESTVRRVGGQGGLVGWLVGPTLHSNLPTSHASCPPSTAACLQALCPIQILIKMSDLGDKKAKTSCLLEFCNRYEEIVMSLLLEKIELPSLLYGIDNHKHQSPLQIQAGPSAYAAARWSTYSPARPSPYPGRSGSPGRRSRSAEEAEMSGELMVAAPRRLNSWVFTFCISTYLLENPDRHRYQIALNNCDFDIDSLLQMNLADLHLMFKALPLFNWSTSLCVARLCTQRHI